MTFHKSLWNTDVSVNQIEHAISCYSFVGSYGMSTNYWNCSIIEIEYSSNKSLEKNHLNEWFSNISSILICICNISDSESVALS